MPDSGHRPSFGLSRVALLVTLTVVALVLWSTTSAQSPAAALKVEAATPTSLTVIWDDAEGATSYAIRWRLVGTPRFGTEVAASGGNHQLTGLLPGRQYVVQVRARDAEGTLVARLTGTLRTVLTTPVGFAVTDTGAGSLTVSWAKPEGWDPSAYELRWRRPSDAPFIGSVRVAGSATSHTLTKLEDQTEYVVNLIALNDVGDSSLDVSDTGWAVGPLSMTLSAANENCPANTRTDLSWEISGGLRPYRFWVHGKRIDPETTQSLRVNCGPLPSGPPADDPMATPTRTFSARVLDGLGTAATARATVNLVTLSPPNLSAPKEASGSVELSWTAPTDWTPSGYRLRWRLPGSLEFLGEVNLGADARSYTLSGLEADREYVLRLTAVHRDSPESRADTARVTLLAPLTLSLTPSLRLCAANTSVDISWEIAGGMPPYTLVVENHAVDSTQESHQVDCGSVLTDPETGDPLDAPTTVRGTVTDARGMSAHAETGVVVFRALPATPTDLALSTFRSAPLTPGSHRFTFGRSDSHGRYLVIDVPDSSFRVIWDGLFISSDGVIVCLSAQIDQSEICLHLGTGEMTHRSVFDTSTDERGVTLSDLFDYIAASARVVPVSVP